MITNAGLDYCLNAAVGGGAAVTTWYVGLIVDTAYAGLSAADTMASHAGWTESTAYAETTRPAWGPATSTAQQSANAVAVAFTSTATQTIKGIFITSVSTKGGATGTLLETRLFTGGDRALTPGQQLTVTIQLTARDATPV